MIKNSYTSKNLIEIDQEFSQIPKSIILDGKNLTISQVIAVARNNSLVELTNNQTILDQIEKTYQKMISDMKNGTPIYGTNTGYGGQANRVLNSGSQTARLNLAKKISESIIHVDVSVGPEFSKEIIRGAVLIRINMLINGISAVRIEDLDIYRQLLNHQITPIVNQYGGIGASGDLAHNGRILSVARGLKGAKARDKNGNIFEGADLLKKAKIPLLNLKPKAGLGLVNGDNFSTSLAASLAVDTLRALLLSTIVGAMTIEVLKGTDRSFHPMLGQIRPHPGQVEIAVIYRFLLNGSKLAYQEMKGHKIRPKGIKVQDGYSLRGISQYHGVNVDKIKTILDTITINANSVSDNPLWVPEGMQTDQEQPGQWVSGANFIAMHMVDVIDSLRKIMTQIVKLNDRHLAKLVSASENNGLPANLSDKKALSGCSFKGVQIQSGMFDVYSSLLSIPVSTFFGIHEETNQDITSHALTSGILGLENLRLVHYSLAQNMLALAQAVDLRGGAKNLSPQTKPLYDLIRTKSSYVEEERPLNNEIEAIYQLVISGEAMEILRNQTFQNFSNGE